MCYYVKVKKKLVKNGFVFIFILPKTSYNLTLCFTKNVVLSFDIYILTVFVCEYITSHFLTLKHNESAYRGLVTILSNLIAIFYCV